MTVVGVIELCVLPSSDTCSPLSCPLRKKEKLRKNYVFDNIFSRTYFAHVLFDDSVMHFVGVELRKSL